MLMTVCVGLDVPFVLFGLRPDCLLVADNYNFALVSKLHIDNYSGDSSRMQLRGKGQVVIGDNSLNNLYPLTVTLYITPKKHF